MYQRSLASLIRSIAQGYPVLVMSGPRQAGKTTLARALFIDRPYVSLEDPLQQESFEDDPRSWLAQFPDGAVIDEIQRCPTLPSYLQGIVDNDERMGRWVLTGSQQYMVLDQITQSLAGRAALLELMPFDHQEIENAQGLPENLAELIWKGGYPPIYDRPVDPTRWQADYLATYIQRDVRSVTAVRNLSSFTRFVKICASRIGQTVNFSDLANQVDIDAKTARSWLSILEAGYIVHLLPAYSSNLGKRVMKSPKLYFMDSGLASYLMGIHRHEDLITHPHWGALVENWVISEWIKCRRHQGWPIDQCYWWRSHDGLEVDLVIDHGSQLSTLEIKAGRSPSPRFAKNQRKFAELTSVANQAVIYLGEQQLSLQGCAFTPWNKLADLVISWGR